MQFLFWLTPLLCLTGCVTKPEPPAPIANGKAPDRILIEARLMEVGKTVSSPRIVATNGEEAQIEIGRFADVPGQVKPVPTGVRLTVLPRIDGGRIGFAGTCEVKRPAGELNQPGFQTASFTTRQAYFAGVVNSGEERRVQLEQPNGPPITLAIKFIIMVNTASR